MEQLAGVVAGLVAPALTGLVKRLFGAGWGDSPAKRLGVFVLFSIVATLTSAVLIALGGTSDMRDLPQVAATAVAVGTLVYRAYQAALGAG